jgi:hypothetical protein
MGGGMSQRNPFRQQLAANERTHKWLVENIEMLNAFHPTHSPHRPMIDLKLMKLKALQSALNVVSYFCWELGGVTVTKGGEDD